MSNISMSATGASGVSQAIAIGNNNNQTAGNQVADAITSKDLTTAEVVALLNQISELLNAATLPEVVKEDAMAYLNAAKKATDKEKPKKEAAAINLKEMAETIENTDKTVEASKNLWEKVQPILVEVAKWLGVAAGSLYSGLS